MSERFDPFNDNEPESPGLIEQLEAVLIRSEEDIDHIKFVSALFRGLSEELIAIISRTPALWTAQNRAGVFELSQLLVQAYGVSEMLIDMSKQGSLEAYYEDAVKEEEHKKVLYHSLSEEWKDKMLGKPVTPQA